LVPLLKPQHTVVGTYPKFQNQMINTTCARGVGGESWLPGVWNAKLMWWDYLHASQRKSNL